MSKEIQKIPITIGLAYNSLAYNKEENNPCLKQFMQYLTSYGKNTSKQLASKLRQKVFELQATEKQRRDLIQICNLQLQSADDAFEMFPNLRKSKTIVSKDIDQLVELINLGK